MCLGSRETGCSAVGGGSCGESEQQAETRSGPVLPRPGTGVKTKQALCLLMCRVRSCGGGGRLGPPGGWGDGRLGQDSPTRGILQSKDIRLYTGTFGLALSHDHVS